MVEIGVGLVGTGFVSDLHANALAQVPAAAVVAVAGTTEQKARAFADEHGIADAVDGHRALLDRRDIDIVSIASPNDTHHRIVLDAAAAGKHVICEKPLARTLAEADDMLAAADDAGVKLMYAECVCFAPKYVRAKQLIDEGALGRLFYARHYEAHSGPHSEWFWQGERSGGGVMMDMACHGAELVRWLHGKPPIESVTAELGRFVHAERTTLDDHALVTIRFAGDRIGSVEASWAKPGGMDDRLELVGSDGAAYADLMRGSALQAYSERGYGYAVEKASMTRGWTYPVADELFEYGMPRQFAHFVDCIVHDREPSERGEDGRVALEVIYAAYRSAGSGRRVSFPLELTETERHAAPYELWR